jgi:hypothetical protein
VAAPARGRWASSRSILIPPQAGMLQGDLGIFNLNYHPDGAVNIDWQELMTLVGHSASKSTEPRASASGFASALVGRPNLAAARFQGA